MNFGLQNITMYRFSLDSNGAVHSLVDFLDLVRVSAHIVHLDENLKESILLAMNSCSAMQGGDGDTRALVGYVKTCFCINEIDLSATKFSWQKWFFFFFFFACPFFSAPLQTAACRCHFWSSWGRCR